MKGKIIAIVVLILIASVVVYYMVKGSDNSSGTNNYTGGNSGGGYSKRKPGYVSGAIVDPYNLLSDDPNDLVTNPAWDAWNKVNGIMKKEERFGGPTPPPEPPRWIYK